MDLARLRGTAPLLYRPAHGRGGAGSHGAWSRSLDRKPHRPAWASDELPSYLGLSGSIRALESARADGGRHRVLAALHRLGPDRDAFQWFGVAGQTLCPPGPP